jgi:hypothetical protein
VSVPCSGPLAAMSADHAVSGPASSCSEAGGCVSRQPGELVFHDRYTIGPAVTMQLVDGEAVIRPDIRSWLRRFPARNLLSLLCQAVHRGEMTNSAARVRHWDLWGEKTFTSAIEHCVNSRKGCCS